MAAGLGPGEHGGADEIGPSRSSKQAATPHHLDYLLQSLKTGDSQAYKHLYGLTADRLFRAAYRMLRSRPDAEDVVQEVFLELVSAECPPDNGYRLEAWLFTGVRYRCGDQFRRRKRRGSSPTDAVPDTADETEPWLGYDPAVEAALDSLTPNQRLIVHLKYDERLDGHTIASITGSNRVAVYAAASRAERSIKRHLNGAGFRHMAQGAMSEDRRR